MVNWLFLSHLTVWQHATWCLVRSLACPVGKLFTSHLIISISYQQSCVRHVWQFRFDSGRSHICSVSRLALRLAGPLPMSSCPVPSCCVWTPLLVSWSASWEFSTLLTNVKYVMRTSVCHLCVTLLQKQSWHQDKRLSVLSSCSNLLLILDPSE